MTIWDSIIGKKSSTTSQATSAGAAASSSSSESLRDTAPSTSFEAPSFQAQDVSSLLSGASIPDPSQLHPLAGLDKNTLDYLTLEETPLADLPGARTGLPSRTWTDDLCYGTGITYVSALGIGGAWGLAEGLNRTPVTAPPKLRLNSVLNSITRRGPFFGNSAGVIALVYNLMNSTIGHYRGKHDALSSLSAGALSGMLFKCTRGVRPMMISSALVTAAAGTWTVSRDTITLDMDTNSYKVGKKALL